jgi:23S rRNA (uracil1939-C5)-methyltransferase
MSDSPSEITAGDELILEIERLAVGGETIARAADGRIVFVRGGAPRDRVRVVVGQVKKRFIRADVVELLATPNSRKPFCDLHASCGGCPWQTALQADREAALSGHLAHSLRGMLHDETDLLPVWGAGDEVQWRSTVRFHWDQERLGYFVVGTNQVLDVSHCPVLHSPLDVLATEVREHLLHHLKGTGVLRMTANPEGTSGTLAFWPEESNVDELWEAVRQFVATCATCHGAVLFRGKRDPLRVGQPFDHLGAFDVVHPAGSFVQAHQTGNAVLVQRVLSLLEGEQSVLELYAGAGNFTFALAAAGHRVVAIERDGEASKAIANEIRARSYGSKVRLIPGAVDALPKGPFDVILMDPPRTGSRGIAERLSTVVVNRLIYVSCDPATLSRDLGSLSGDGWRLEHVQPFDLFPYTGHMETLAVLSRGQKNG